MAHAVPRWKIAASFQGAWAEKEDLQAQFDHSAVQQAREYRLAEIDRDQEDEPRSEKEDVWAGHSELAAQEVDREVWVLDSSLADSNESTLAKMEHDVVLDADTNTTPQPGQTQAPRPDRPNEKQASHRNVWGQMASWPSNVESEAARRESIRLQKEGRPRCDWRLHF